LEQKTGLSTGERTVGGSLLTGSVRVSELVRVLHGGGRPSALGRALAEVGRIAKTIFLLAYLDDEAYRRRILTQINRGEARHALARKAPTVTAVSCASPTARARRTSSAPSGSSSAPSLSGTLATWPPPSSTSVPTRATSGRRTSDASHPYATATSISTVATTSPPPTPSPEANSAACRSVLRPVFCSDPLRGPWTASAAWARAWSNALKASCTSAGAEMPRRANTRAHRWSQADPLGRDRHPETTHGVRRLADRPVLVVERLADLTEVRLLRSNALHRKVPLPPSPQRQGDQYRERRLTSALGDLGF
jgi:Tn3 transposase DDE domain